MVSFCGSSLQQRGSEMKETSAEENEGKCVREKGFDVGRCNDQNALVSKLRSMQMDT